MQPWAQLPKGWLCKKLSHFSPMSKHEQSLMSSNIFLVFGIHILGPIVETGTFSDTIKTILTPSLSKTPFLK